MSNSERYYRDNSVDQISDFYKYLKYKSKYHNLLKQLGGAMKEDDFKRIKIHNYNVFFDKGSDNIWMTQEQKDAVPEQVRQQFIREFNNLCDQPGYERDWELIQPLINKFTTEQLTFLLNKPDKGSDLFPAWQKLLAQYKQTNVGKISDPEKRRKLVERALELAQTPDAWDTSDTDKYSDLNVFEKCLSQSLDDRYYVRQTNLENLLKSNTIQFGDIIDLDFLDDFYINLFKGTAFKKYFHKDTKITEDLRKRFNIFLEYTEEIGGLPQKRYYTFVDNPNPCHLIKIMKDEFKRGDSIDQMPVKYAFVNIKELGKGKAGTASLLGYFNEQPVTGGQLQVAAKLMDSSQFDITNDGAYLPLRIAYFEEGRTRSGVARLDRNIRFLYPVSERDTIEQNYLGYGRYNIFETDHQLYKSIMLSVASDNFSNQTLMHMIIGNILEPFKLNNYVKQFDAMLCYSTDDTFTAQEGQSWYEFFKSNAAYARTFIAKQFDQKTARVDGLNFMEIADQGDLHGHLFNIQKKRFMKVRNPQILDKNAGLRQNLADFLNDMINQILRPLSILQHPKYAFVHGDLKTKNIFVKTGKSGTIYKLADYDKSSINYNGIRFHNEGNRFVQFYFTKWGGSTQLSPEQVEQPPKDASIDRDEPLSFKDQVKRLRNSGSDDLDKILSVHDVVIKYISQNSQLPEGLPDLLQNLKIKQLLRHLKSSYGSRFGISEPTTGSIIDRIMVYYQALLKCHRNGQAIDVYYTLNSFLTKASLFITSLEKVEFEQLFVRYSPIPFYHTIDLYTLFLSLLQSPMILVYLRWCHLNQDTDIVKDDLFWRSFRDLWSSNEDVYTILGYYEHLLKHPVLEDIASVGFILDPIKKNPIGLLKKVGDGYWDRAWRYNNPKNSYAEIKDAITKRDEPPKQYRLSLGTHVTLPQICLSDCDNFNLKAHRGSTVFYLNRDLVIHSFSTVGERVALMLRNRDALQNDLRDKYKQTLQMQLLHYLNRIKTLSTDQKKMLKLGEAPATIPYPPKPESTPLTDTEWKEILSTHRPIIKRQALLRVTPIFIKKIVQILTEEIGDSEFDDVGTIASESEKDETSEKDMESIDEKLQQLVLKLDRSWTDCKSAIPTKFIGRDTYHLENINRDQCIQIISESEQWQILSDLPMQYLISMTNPHAKRWEGDKWHQRIKEYLVERYKCLRGKILRSDVIDSFPVINIGEFTDIESIEQPLVENLRTETIAKMERQYKSQLEDWETAKAEIDQINRNSLQLAKKGEADKLEQIRKNLNDPNYPGLNEYVTRVFVSRRDLINVCLTNTYRDFFGYHLNWDFCPMTDHYLENVFREVQLF